MKPDQYLITPEDAAKIIGCSPRQVRYYIMRKRNPLKGYNLGGDGQPRWYVDKRDIERFLAAPHVGRGRPKAEK